MAISDVIDLSNQLGTLLNRINGELIGLERALCGARAQVECWIGCGGLSFNSETHYLGFVQNKKTRDWELVFGPNTQEPRRVSDLPLQTRIDLLAFLPEFIRQYEIELKKKIDHIEAALRQVEPFGKVMPSEQGSTP